MRRYILWGTIAIVAVLIVWGVVFYFRELRGVGPALRPAPDDITQLVPPSEPTTAPPPPAGENSPPSANTTGMPLKLPAGFSISLFAKNVHGARDMAFASDGNLWVSRTGAGNVMMLEVADGIVKSQNDVVRALSKPHGLAFDPDNPLILYIAQGSQIARLRLATEAPLEKVIDLPSGGNHNYYSLRFGPDKRLYVAMGSTCNVCIEKDARRAKIYSLNPDGTDFREFARGLRNAPFMAFHPTTKKLWATEMGRDFLGDNTPPDEINIVEEGKNYGWPICYGKNIHDTDFDKNTYVRNPCMEPFEMPSAIDIPAHSAPLGLGFIPADSAWPQEYWHDLIVAYHGSWNRSAPTGYKVVRMKFDAAGNYQGTEDFITGWLTSSGALGRPVGILIRNNDMYISDDKAGVIYKVAYFAPR